MMVKRMYFGLVLLMLTACTAQNMQKDSGQVQSSLQQVESAAAVGSSAPIMEYGSIEKVDAQEKQIRLKTLESSLILYISEETALINLSTGKQISWDGLKEGEEIYAALSPEYSYSDPAGTVAYALLTEPKEEFVPYCIEAAEVEKADGQYRVKDTKGFCWLFDENVRPVLLRTEKTVDFSDLQKGERCLVWPKILPVEYENAHSDMPELQADKLVILR